jgi:hypothetical protein
MAGEQLNENIILYLPDDKHRTHYNQIEIHYILKKITYISEANYEIKITERYQCHWYIND